MTADVAGAAGNENFQFICSFLCDLTQKHHTKFALLRPAARAAFAVSDQPEFGYGIKGAWAARDPGVPLALAQVKGPEGRGSSSASPKSALTDFTAQ